MNAIELRGFFRDIGARLEVHGVMPRRFGQPIRLGDANEPTERRRVIPTPYRLDIVRDDHGEHFRMDVRLDAPDFQVLQARRDERHLLLFARERGAKDGDRLLCGHDERHWFTAAVAERVSTVMAARRALLPRDLRHRGLNKSTLTSRHNAVFMRQGEWFFVPVTDAKLLRSLNELPIHSWEPIQRGRQNKAHRCEHLVRFGGTQVFINRGREYSQAEWMRMNANEKRAAGRVEERVKDMTVYVRGRVQHPDHATITLPGWHHVMLNGEIVSSNVTFYD